MVIVLLWFLAMKNVAIADLGVTYIRSIGEHAPATIVGPSTRGDDFIHLKYMRKTKKLKDADALPHPSHAQFGKWVSEAWNAISDDELRSAMRKAIFPNGMKLSQLEDFLEHHPANAKPDCDSDSSHDSGTDSDSEILTSDDSQTQILRLRFWRG